MDDEKRIPKDEWVNKVVAERAQLIEQQNSEIEKAVSSGKNLVAYLVGRGRLGSRFSSGNAALILAKNPKARVAMSMQEWNNYGRRINRGAQGTMVLARKGKYWGMDHVYELAQTYGDKPYKMLDVVSTPVDAKNAANALVTLSTVEVIPVAETEQAVAYDSNSKTIAVNTKVDDVMLLQQLPKAIMEACWVHDTENPQDKDLTKLYSECVRTEFCGRFGIPLPPDTEKKLDDLCPLFVKGKERDMLDEVRTFSRLLGDRVEEEFRPLQPAHNIKKSPPTVDRG